MWIILKKYQVKGYSKDSGGTTNIILGVNQILYFKLTGGHFLHGKSNNKIQ